MRRAANVFGAGVACAVALVATLVWAADFKQVADGEWSPISGTPGTVMEGGSPAGGIYAISVTENFDRPFRVAGWYHSLSTEASAGGSFGLETFHPGFGGVPNKTATVGADHYITAFQVCTNNDRIKGLRVWGRRIMSDGTLSATPSSDSFELPNCKGQWQTKVSCGPKRVATRLRAYTKDSYSFSGLAMRCTGFEPR